MKVIAFCIEEHYRNLQYNVAIIGWLGDILSIITLICSTLTLHYRSNIVQLLSPLLQRGYEDVNYGKHFCLLKFLTMAGTAGYALSLLNMLVSTLLLLGVAKRCRSMLFPWLVYYGVLFGIAVHLIMCLVLCSLYIDFSVFAIGLLVNTLAMLVFTKVYNEVYLLYKTMHLINVERPSGIQPLTQTTPQTSVLQTQV